MKNLKNSLRITQLFYLSGLLGTFFATNLFSMHTSETEKLQIQFFEKQDLIETKEAETRNVLIFLDDSEKELGGIGGMVLTGLCLKNYPIILSTSLLYNVHEAAKKDIRPIKDLLNDSWSDYSSGKFKEFAEKESIILSRICFEQEPWIIKKINDSLVLLIPKVYLETLHINGKQVDYNKNVELPSETELKLGFKVNHMETITIDQIERPKDFKFADYFVEAMDSIFCTNSDYRIAKQQSPEWVMYIEGHGRIGTRVVGLSLNGFQQFLHFLEHKIKTQLLMYVSCFAVGANTDKIFGNMKSQVKAQYSFPIIVNGINDVVRTDQAPDIDMHKWHEREELTYILHFDSPFEIAQKIKEGNFKHLFSYVSKLFQIPQIKLPGIEWLSVDIVDKKVVSIGSILAQTQDPQKPLNIVSFFKKDPEIILLYTDEIPFELTINSKNLQGIFSMMSSGSVPNEPERIFHKIKKISSATHSFVGILQWFMLTGTSGGSKCFFIDEIDGYKDILIFGTKDYGTKVYFKDNNDKPIFKGNTLFMAEIERVYSNPIEKALVLVKHDSDEEKDYNDRILEMRSREIRREISSEQIKKMENVIAQKYEKQKERQKSKEEKQQLVEEVLARQRVKQLQEVQK